MNTELQTALAEFVNRATNLLDAGTAQLPAILTDIVAYALFNAWAAVYLGITALVLAVVGFVVHGAVDYCSPLEPIGFIGGLTSGVVGLLFLPAGIYNVYYVTHFPRLVILDYLKGLL